MQTSDRDRDLLDRILAGDDTATSFALLRRPGLGADECELYAGEVVLAEEVGDLEPMPGTRLLVLLPYRQLLARGYDAVDDGAPLHALRVVESQVITTAELAARVRPVPEIVFGEFDLSDDAFAEKVRRVQEEDIAAGKGANFVMSRSLRGQVPDYRPSDVLTLALRLIAGEQGAYWMFAVHTPHTTLVGATPELHLKVEDGTASMNPISGTLPVTSAGLDTDQLLDFLGDRKEIDELSMVLDEELKMMSSICVGPVGVTGPSLRVMSRVVHTEYLIAGRAVGSLSRALGQSVFAPTVTGSPLRSACTVITQREPQGRRYYAGVIALLDGGSADRAPSLDSSILIRTAEISPKGEISIRVGSTVVRHSDPYGEARETRAKAEGLLRALASDVVSAKAPRPARAPIDDTGVQRALMARNEGLSHSWFGSARANSGPHTGWRCLVLDCEDSFTAMIAVLLEGTGVTATIRSVEDPFDPYGFDLVVLGPGPGNPLDTSIPRIAAMEGIVARCLADEIPLLAVCLGHQVLAAHLGLRVARRETPNQGTQRRINLFGSDQLCGFYNSFAAGAPADELLLARARGPVELSRDEATGEVYAMRGAGFASLQFHPESILTQHGQDILAEACSHALGHRARELEEVVV
jgi:phenazine biosynthesis protein phzE